MNEYNEYTELLKRIDADTASVSNDKSAYSVYTSKKLQNNRRCFGVFKCASH